MKNGRRFGSPPKPYEPPEQPTGKINVTDPDSRNLKTPRGYLQGYNAQLVCNGQQIVLAAEISVSSADFGQLGPMMIAAAERELTAAGIGQSRRRWPWPTPATGTASRSTSSPAAASRS